jgi:hypothetical protein
VPNLSIKDAIKRIGTGIVLQKSNFNMKYPPILWFVHILNHNQSQEPILIKVSFITNLCNFALLRITLRDYLKPFSDGNTDSVANKPL